MSNTSTSNGPTHVDLLPNRHGLVLDCTGQVWVGVYTEEKVDIAPVRLFTASDEGETMETYMTPNEARELAAWLVGAASRCDREERLG